MDGLRQVERTTDPPLRVAALDIGTNSVRVLVAERLGDSLRWLDRRVRVVRLGEGLDRDGRLSEEAMARALAVLEEYGEALRDWHVEAVRAVATSAARDAVNREELLERAEEAVGVRPDLISGEEEGRLSFRGAVAGLPGEPAPLLVVDVGGGSTEFVFGHSRPEGAVSVDIGSVRLTERLLPDRPAPPGQVGEARGYVEALFAGVRLPTPATVVGVAGTFTSLAGITLELPTYDPERIHGTRLSLTDLDLLVERLAAMTVEETADLPSLDPARAPVLLAGAVVAEAALRRSGSSVAVVSEADLLDGVAWELSD